MTVPNPPSGFFAVNRNAARHVLGDLDAGDAWVTSHGGALGHGGGYYVLPDAAQ